MTGPLGPMNDDGVVDLLRAAGHGGADASPADVTRAMTAGRKIRRRRQTMQVVGSSVAAAVVLAAGFAAVSATGDDGRESVTAAGDPTSKPAPAKALPASEQRLANLQLLATALGPDFRVNPKGREAGDSTTDPKVPLYPVVEVVPGSPTAEGLPSGYRMTATGGVPSYDLTLEARCKPVVEKSTHRSACEPVTTTDGRRAFVQEFRVEFGKV